MFLKINRLKFTFSKVKKVIYNYNMICGNESFFCSLTVW